MQAVPSTAAPVVQRAKPISVEASAIPAEGFMRVPQILAVIPVCKATWWTWVRTGFAPAPIRLGKRCTMWQAADIRAFIDHLSAGDAQEAAA